jgi:peptidoglycan/LPS O-acetylase OafA/YrhL
MLVSQGTPWQIWVLRIAVFFQALSGLYGGGALLADPTGAELRMPLTMLNGTPFADFRIPGAILFIMLGLYPVLVLVGLHRRRVWSWWAAAVLGAALIVWIVAQVWLIGYGSLLQPLYGLLGVLIVTLVATPATRRYLGRK